MNGIELLADTNFIINLNQGFYKTEQFVEYKVSISFITEIELIGAFNISKEQREIYKKIVSQLFVYNINDKIKLKTIEVRNQYKLKIPDAIIAATALVYDLPLITSDKEFQKIKDLNLIFLEKE